MGFRSGGFVPVVSGFSTCQPKLHMLLHLPDNIFNFGPAIGFATERLDTYLIRLDVGTKIFISDRIGFIKLFHSRIRHSDFDI